ncbi:MAG: methyltransferase domain-containing protein [Tissierellia bacterium]|nr:methyltransferase domain-containing protein [Tissierellia bacterium]
MRWFKDSDFIRGDVPMTKFDIRVIISSFFNTEKNRKILEIGSGTGSITCQLAEMGFDIISIDFLSEAVDLTKENLKKLGLKADIIKGKAPKDLPDVDLDACFIGGSRGELDNIFEYLDKNMKKGLLVASFIKMDNLYRAKSLMKEYSYKNIETRLVQVSYEDRLGLLKAQNPIFIIKGDRYD